jgi:hypothetical protein
MRMIVPACAAALMVMAGSTILCLNPPKSPAPPVQAIADLASPTPIVLANLPWDRAHRAELVTLKSHADALMIAGTYRQASDVYQLILTLTADREVTDPVAAEIVNSARERQTKVLVLARAAEQAASTSEAIVQVHTIPIPTEPLPASPVEPALVPVAVAMKASTDDVPQAVTDVLQAVATSTPAQVATIDSPRHSVFADDGSQSAANQISPGARSTQQADSGLDRGSSLPDLSAQTSPGQSSPGQSSPGYNYGTSNQYAKPATPVRGTASAGGTGYWWARLTGPPDATATVTEGGHTYQMGGPGGKRFIWGVGTGPVVGHVNK